MDRDGVAGQGFDLKSLVSFVGGVCTGGVISVLAGDSDASGFVIGVFAALGFYVVLAAAYLWARRLWWQALGAAGRSRDDPGASGSRPA